MSNEVVIKVADKVPELVSLPPRGITCDNSDYTVVWQLDEEWAQFEHRTMQVNYSDGTYERVLFTGDSCALPAIPVKDLFYVGLFAGDIHTTRPLRLFGAKAVTTGDGEERTPMPNGYAQAIAALDGKLDRNQGAANAGKALVINKSGDVVPGTASSGGGGADGKSAYEIAVENGFEGDETAWLKSLKGEKGDAGAKGETGPLGPQGEKGEQGPKGNTGPAGADGAPGKDGAPGTPGKNGTTFTPSVSAAGDLSWTNDGGKANPAPVNLKGPQGETGPQGPTGATGPQGAPGADYTLTKADKTEIAAEAAAAIAGTSLPAPASAAVGQIVKIKAVDAEGKITQTEAVDLPSGGGEDAWEKIADVALTTDTSVYEVANFGVYRKVKVLMSRAAYVSGLDKNVWFRIWTASQLGTVLARLYMANEYGYRAWEIDAEVGDLFMRMTKISANNLNSPSAPVITVADLSPQNPAEYRLYIEFTDTSVIQDGDTVAVYGVKR